MPSTQCASARLHSSALLEDKHPRTFLPPRPHLCVFCGSSYSHGHGCHSASSPGLWCSRHKKHVVGTPTDGCCGTGPLSLAACKHAHVLGPIAFVLAAVKCSFCKSCTAVHHCAVIGKATATNNQVTDILLQVYSRCILALTACALRPCHQGPALHQLQKAASSRQAQQWTNGCNHNTAGRTERGQTEKTT